MSQPDKLPCRLGPALEFLQRLWRLNHALERLSGNMTRRLGITAQQRLVLRCIGSVPGLTSGQLAALLCVDPGTTSAALRRLEAKGLVTRRRDRRDRRRSRLELTARGLKVNRPAPGTVEHAVKRLLADQKKNTLQAASRVLEQLSDKLLDEMR